MLILRGWVGGFTASAVRPLLFLGLFLGSVLRTHSCADGFNLYFGLRIYTNYFLTMGAAWFYTGDTVLILRGWVAGLHGFGSEALAILGLFLGSVLRTHACVDGFNLYFGSRIYINYFLTIGTAWFYTGDTELILRGWVGGFTASAVKPLLFLGVRTHAGRTKYRPRKKYHIM